MSTGKHFQNNPRRTGDIDSITSMVSSAQHSALIPVAVDDDSSLEIDDAAAEVDVVVAEYSYGSAAEAI